MNTPKNLLHEKSEKTRKYQNQKPAPRPIGNLAPIVIDADVKPTKRK